MIEEKYQKVSARIEADYYPYHTEEWFTHDDICRFFQWDDQELRKAVSQKLWNDYKRLVSPKLEKRNKAYRLIDKSIDEIDWMNADIEDVYKLNFPYGVWDKTRFDFENNILISPKGIVLVAGASNMGKTGFVMNVLVLNMDKYKCSYFTNELSEIGLKRRFRGFEDWCELLDGDGKPKFRTILRYDNYQDVIDPNGLNIIDYLDVNVEGEYFKLVPYVKQIQRALNKGIAVITLQKPPGRQDAYGGFNLRGAASLYLSIDQNKLEVVKAKDWITDNPNGRKYSFKLEHYGCVFSEIKGIYEGD